VVYLELETRKINKFKWRFGGGRVRVCKPTEIARRLMNAIQYYKV
jgi:hypothetical protein